MPRSRDREIADAMAAIEAFENPAAWRRSSKGNLWRTWEDRTVTIFYRNRRYHWSIADEEGPQFSTGSYGDEADAMSGLGEVLGVGEC